MRTAFITTRLRRWHFSWLLILMCLIVPAAGQVKDSRKFRAVPAPLRQRLVERFNLYIEYERTQQYKKLFDLLSQTYIANQNLSRAHFPEYRSRNKLIDFKLKAVSTSIIVGNTDEYEITGMAKFQRGENISSEEVLLKAYWQDGDWYFSEWLIRLED
ncbi:MAG TPA: hypothetical protein VF658_18025 [Pyrinomonadaceae bacterium]|jgi:hypothetical protein